MQQVALLDELVTATDEQLCVSDVFCVSLQECLLNDFGVLFL